MTGGWGRRASAALINQGLKVRTDPGWKDPAGDQKIGIVRTIVVNAKEYRLFDI